MKRFRYSLEVLLSLRRRKEQDCRNSLARAAGELSAVESRMDQAERMGARAFEIDVRDIADMRFRDRLWAKSVNDRLALEKPHHRAREAMDTAGAAYTEALAERKALSRIREKRLEQWKADRRRMEFQNLDETAKGGALRKLIVGGDE